MTDVIFGTRPVVEALRSRRRKVFEIFDSSNDEEISRLAGEKGVRVKKVSRKDVDDLVSGVHQGVAAKAAGYPYVSLEEILNEAAPLVVVLDGVTDPHNLGAVLRAADGAGVSGVVIPKDRSAHVNPTAVKASAGASEHVKVARVTNLRRAVEEMKDAGVWTYAAEGASPISHTDLDFTGGVGVVLGSEGKGVRRLVREGCDGGVSIPMFGEVSSLNVSVAAAVLLYEARRQRGFRA